MSGSQMDQGPEEGEWEDSRAEAGGLNGEKWGWRWIGRSRKRRMKSRQNRFKITEGETLPSSVSSAFIWFPALALSFKSFSRFGLLSSSCSGRGGAHADVWRWTVVPSHPLLPLHHSTGILLLSLWFVLCIDIWLWSEPCTPIGCYNVMTYWLANFRLYRFLCTFIVQTALSVSFAPIAVMYFLFECFLVSAKEFPLIFRVTDTFST